MASGKKRKAKDNIERTEGKGYGAIGPDKGDTGIYSSSSTARVTGGNGINDYDEEKGDELSLLVDKRGGALVDGSEDEENKKEKVAIGEVIQGVEMGKDDVRDGWMVVV